MLPLTLPEYQPGLISVTVPSRHRPGMLTASLASLRDLAADPGRLEILVACDPDDPGTAETAVNLGARIWQAPYRFGYAQSARYYAALISQAHGEWVLPTWGDDGLMQTPGWDRIVRAQEPGTVLWVDGNIPGLTCFPIVHAAALAAVGRLPNLPALDSWWEYAARAAGVLRHPDPPIYVHQDRYDLTGRNDDLTYREGRSGYRPAEFFDAPYTARRLEDAAALRAAKETS